MIEWHLKNRDKNKINGISQNMSQKSLSSITLINVQKTSSLLHKMNSTLYLTLLETSFNISLKFT